MKAVLGFLFEFGSCHRESSGQEVESCKRENAAGGEWKLPSQPIGMGDRTKEAGAKQFRIEILDLAEFYN